MNFKTTKKPTAYGYFDSDPSFQREADSFIVYAERVLGATVLSVELSRSIYWTQLEAAVIKWCNLVNEYDFTSYMTDLIGKPRPLVAPEAPGDPGNISGLLTKASNDFFDWRSYSFSVSAGLSGNFTPIKGVIRTEPGKQDYDLKTELMDMRFADQDPVPALWSAPENKQGMRMRVLEIYHFDNSYVTLNFRPRTAINLFVMDATQGKSSMFNFQYMLPTFDDTIRAQHIKQATQLRRSQYTWKLRGTRLSIFPIPTSEKAFPVFVDVAFVPGWVGNGLEGQGEIGAGEDVTSFYTVPNGQGTGTITNLSNVPYGLFEFGSINSIGREWIRNYALALCKISLGNIRGKYGSFPIPSDTLTLNGSEMISQGQSEAETLIANLRERLDALTSTAALERKAGEAENLTKINSTTPPRKAIYVF
jgi:hypothetical protein